jgi:hypothetical protein
MVRAASLLALLAAARASAEVTSGNEAPLLPGPGPGAEPPPVPPPDAGAPPPPAPTPDGGPPTPAASDAEQPPAIEPAPLPLAPSAEIDRWPMEYVLRPQTLPAGMIGLAAGASAFWPDHPVMLDLATGQLYAFHPSLSLGTTLELGVSDLTEINFTLPRILCFATGDPSACSTFNRWNGSGVNAEVGLVRAPHAQLELQSGIGIGSSSPVRWRWSLAASAKVLPAARFALRARLELAQYANQPAGVANPLFAYATASADVQATRRLRLFASLMPWGSLGDVGEGIALEVFGGASFNFTRRSQVSFELGNYNLLSQPAWSRFVPGWFAGADLVFWFD